ncbi:MAG: hypothetical protein K2K48_03560 [Anaeroplasmataceae bacterium]|nr:hypothetical protein [Anaeroplasmataceae bacterium]
MLFNSIEFLIFLPIVFILYWIMPKKYRWIILLIASYIFYMYWNWKLVFLILFTTIVSYICSLLVEKFQEKKGLKRGVVIVSTILCLGVLLFFKYFNFFYEIIEDIKKAISGQGFGGYFVIMLPVGISFYTFQTLSYVIDVYRGNMKAEKHFGYYALFVSFFPQLVAGPIERPQDLLPQLKKEQSFKKIDYSGAFRYMLIGAFKKVAVADMIGIIVNATYSNVADANGLMILISTFLFAFQIYCDFSGYSDIAVGTAKLFGINLTENFNSPYQSKSIKEFWNRWHISLSKWLRDYIYFPLGGSRVSKIRWCFNILVVFFISGLWHGASYNFVIWGLLHAGFQIIGALTLKQRNKLWCKIKLNPEGKFVGAVRLCITFLLVDFTWIFFRANSISDSATAITKLFTDWSFNLEYFKYTWSQLGLSLPLWIYSIFGILIMLTLEKLKKIHVEQNRIYKNSIFRFGCYLILGWCLIYSWIYLQATDVGSSFIYFQF